MTNNTFSDIDICNQALGLVGSLQIESMDEDGDAARKCKRIYELTVQKALTETFWTFATKRKKLTKNAKAPEFGFSSSYKLPSDFLAVVSINEREGIGEERSIEGGDLLCDDEEVHLVYLARVPEGMFSANFIDCLIRLLASKLAVAMFKDTAMSESHYSIYRNELRTAMFKDSRNLRVNKSTRSNWMARGHINDLRYDLRNGF